MIASSFLGLAYVFEALELSGTEINPNRIITAAIALYTGKECKNLAAIFGIFMENKSENPLFSAEAKGREGGFSLPTQRIFGMKKAMEEISSIAFHQPPKVTSCLSYHANAS